jgi:hypothetical protein
VAGDVKADFSGADDDDFQIHPPGRQTTGGAMSV